MRIMVSTLAISSGAAFLEHAIKRFEHAPGLVDRRRGALQHQMIAARRGGDLQPLLDEGEVLVEIAIKLRGEAVVFEGQFKLRGKGVVWGGGQMPVQVLEIPSLFPA